MLKIFDLHARINHRLRLQNIDIKAKAGDITALCGPNGAGKTSLLRAILGDLPSGGQLTLNGLNLRHMPPRLLAGVRAVLAQETHIAFDFTVDEIVGMGQEAGDFALQTGVIAEALTAVGLRGYEPRRFQTLSGGEKQRVHLARALAQVWEPVSSNGPRWLFLDEPVAALDVGHQLHVMQLLRRYADKGGGVLLVIHDLNLAAQFADHLVFLINGHIHAAGSPDETLTAPLLEKAYQCKIQMNTAPSHGPWFVLQSGYYVETAFQSPALPENPAIEG